MGVIRLGRTLTLLLWLPLAAVMLTLLLPAPHSRALSYNSTSLTTRLSGSYRVLSVLCDSNETTTSSGETVTTVGTPCEPTDVAANQSEYLLVILGALLLFGLFFLIGYRLWT